MNNVQIRLVLIFGLLLFAIWAVSFTLTLRDTQVQLALVSSVGVAFLVLTIGRAVPLDIRLMSIITLGYCFGGKGFAYVSPAPPIFIGEIVLGIAGLLFIYRYLLQPRPLFFHPLQLVVVLMVFVGGLKMYLDFRSFGLLAIRDYSMVYYGMYFYFASVVFLKYKSDKLFVNAMLIGSFLGGVSLIASMTGVLGAVLSVAPSLPYQPHNDIMIPCVVACLMVCIFALLERSRTWVRLLIVLLSGLIVLNKTSYIFSTFVTVCFVSLGVKSLKMIKVGVVMAVFGLIAFSAIIMTGLHTKLGADKYGVLGDVERFSEDGKGYERSTTEWRMVWWETVYKQTMASNPTLGTGFGSDISSEFYWVYYGRQLNAEQKKAATRYPHNILFSVFGRTGFVGLAAFATFFIVVVRFLYEYSKLFLRRPKPELKDVLICSFVAAGLANAFVQATYEPPYAAIPHWIGLGWLMARYLRFKRGELKEVEVKGKIVLQ